MTSPERSRWSWPTHGFAASVLLVLLTMNVLWARPEYNWDMLPYVAIAYQFGGASPTDSHERTYQLLRQTLPAEYAQLAEGNDYRRIAARDAVTFNQQLPMYRVKLVYPWLMWQLTRSGIDPVRASVLISRLAYLALGLVVLFWISSWTGPVAAVAASWAVMSQTFALDLAQLSTPDAISTLILLAALWSMFEKARPRSALLLLVASIFVRPDNVLWLIAAAAICALRDRDQRVFAAIVTGAGLLLVTGLSAWADLPGWRTLFHHAFVERVLDHQRFQPTLSFFDYVRVYLRQTHPANLPQFLLTFGLVGTCLFWYRVRRFGWKDNLVGVLATAGSFALMHWLLLPVDDRFFVAVYLLISMALLQTLLFAGARPTAPDPHA